MSQTLTRWQAAMLGAVVLAAVGLGVFGLIRIAAKQGFGRDTFEVSAAFPEANDVTPGTPVRVRGIEAGQVVGVAYPETDEPGNAVTLTLRLDAKFSGRLYADASARIQSTGLLGSKVVAVNPGTPAAGPLGDGRLAGTLPPDLADATAKLRDTAAEAEQLLREVRQSNGTLAKLLKDDDLYHDLKDLTAETRGFVKRADGAVTAVEAEIPAVRGLVRDGQDTLRSVRANSDAVKRMPVVRSYVEDAAALLVRPAHSRERMVYQADDLFLPDTALLSDAGRYHLAAAAEAIRQARGDKSDIVVAAFHDPAARDQTPESAMELTRKRGETAAEFLRGLGVHKTAFWRWNLKVTPLGMGMTSSPVVESAPLPASRVEVLLFTPQ